MAGARIQKLGTIFSRQQGLLKSGAVKWEDRPMWYDIYEAFPPLREPTFFQDPPENFKLRQIFYREDILRAQFAEKYGKNLIPVNINASSKDVPTLEPPEPGTTDSKRRSQDVS